MLILADTGSSHGFVSIVCSYGTSAHSAYVPAEHTVSYWQLHVFNKSGQESGMVYSGPHIH